jgi:hypothetical protein
LIVSDTNRTQGQAEQQARNDHWNNVNRDVSRWDRSSQDNYNIEKSNQKGNPSS